MRAFTIFKMLLNGLISWECFCVHHLVFVSLFLDTAPDRRLFDVQDKSPVDNIIVCFTRPSSRFLCFICFHCLQTMYGSFELTQGLSDAGRKVRKLSLVQHYFKNLFFKQKFTQRQPVYFQHSGLLFLLSSNY